MKFSQKHLIILFGLIVIAGAGIYLFNRNSTVPQQAVPPIPPISPSRIPPGAREDIFQTDYVFSLSVSDERDVRNRYISEENHILLRMKSEVIYGCFNFRIIFEEQVTEFSAELEVVNIQTLPSENGDYTCLTALGPALGTADLGFPRDLALSIVRGDIVDTYQIRFEDGSFLVEPTEGSFTGYVPEL